MENNNSSNKGVMALLIVIIVIVAVLCVLFATGTISFNKNKNTNNNDNTVNNSITEDNNQQIENNNTINDEKSNNEDNTINSIKLEGTYNKEIENELSYYKSTVIITNETETSIDFKISAVHGKDSENVNVGNISGKANKIGEYKYQFEETIEGKTNTITFEFSFHRTFQYLTINENYPNSINPYGGHGVYFASEYLKIS